MKYYIKPRLFLTEPTLWLFSDEIYQMTLSMIDDGIESCRRVMSDECPELSWGLEVSELLIHKVNSTLEYHGKFVAEIPTVEIYDMLKTYRNKLQEYGSEQE